MKKAFAKVAATLVATSLLAASFGPVYVSATNDQLAARESADGATGAGHSELWDNGFDREARRDSHGAIAEEGRSNGLKGEITRRSKLSGRATSLFHQSSALQKLLTAALVSMGMLSAVRLGKELMRGPSDGDEEAFSGGRPSTVAGLPNRSLPNGLLVGALMLLVASSLASPLLPKRSPRQADEVNEVGSERYSSRLIDFFYKGKHCELTFSPEERGSHKISNEDLNALESALNRLPSESTFNEEGGGTEYIWTLGSAPDDPEKTPRLNVFSLSNGRQYWVELPQSIADCNDCRRKLQDLGKELAKYETFLTSYELQTLPIVRSGGEPPVEYMWNEGRTKCTVGGSPTEDDHVAEFSVGETDFKIVIPPEVKDALAGKAGNQGIVGSLDKNSELLDQLVEELSRKPEMKSVPKDPEQSVRGDLVVLRKNIPEPDKELKWGNGEYKQKTRSMVLRYEVGLPQFVPVVLRKSNNDAWNRMTQLLDVALRHILAAMVRENAMKLNVAVTESSV